jgi:uncharacterized protein
MRLLQVLTLLSLTTVAFTVEQVSVTKAHPFPLDRVELLDSPFRKAMEINRAYLLRLDPDRFLWPFHERAGLPAKADRYGGWERKDCVGQIGGHYLSACSLMVAATGDGECRKRVDYMTSELARVQAKHGNGYAGAVRTEVWETTFAGQIKVHKWGLGGGYVPWYVLHKSYAGLIDAYTHADSKQALDVATGFADWAKKGTDGLTDDQFQKMLGCEYGGMNEAMANLYALTGRPDYLALAKRFDHKEIFDPLAAERDQLAGKHVNTQLPKLVGAARMYELTGEERYATIGRFLWERVIGTRSFAPGGVDFHEHFREPGTEAEFLNWDSCETCATYNMLRLTRHVFGWRPEARYMDYYERALYNHILGSQDPESGGFTYFYSLKPGHFKTYSTPFDSMWCCVGTGMENHCKYGDTIYFHGDDTLWVDLFIPSQLDWKERGVTIRQETAFPREETTALTVSAKKPSAFSLKIRVPYWATRGVEVRINGRKEPVDAKPQSYLVLTRTWKDGDRVEIRLPMGLHLYRARDDAQLGVVMYGPLVLAGELGREGMPESCICGHNKQHSGLPVPPVPMLVAESDSPSEWVKRIDPGKLRFRTQNVGRPHDVSLRPLHEMHHQRYTVYWRMLTQAQWEKEQAEREANLATAATPSTSYVSGDTTLGALNDGHTPRNSQDRSRRAYGNWPKKGTQWVQYEWSRPISTCAMDVYWWNDRRGVRDPKACRLLYWNGKEFVPVKGAKGLGVEESKFNTTTFEEVTTSKLRLEIDSSGEFSTGILDWRVHDPGRMTGGALGRRIVRDGEGKE